VAADGGLPLSRIRLLLVALIFLFTGLTLPWRSLLSAVAHWRLQLAILALSLLLTPLALWALQDALSSLLGAELATGLVILAALPTTITSGVVLTREAGGNVAAAVLAAAGGNLLGVVVSPLWISLAVGTQAELDPWPVMRSLALLVLAPLALGMLLRLGCRAWCDERRKQLGIASNLCLLLILWPSLAGGFVNGDSLPASGTIALAGGLAVALHLLLLAAAWGTGRALGFARDDRICLLFAGSHKTLALGLPLLVLLFGDDPRLALFSLPLVIYHPLQLVIDAAIAPRL